MSLPKQVQRQAEEAERLEKELEAANNPQPNPEPTPEPAPQPTEAVGEVVQPVEVTPPAPEPKPVITDEPWEQRYKTLQGMFNAETGRLGTQVKELTVQLQTALEKLESIGKPTEPAAPATPLVTPKDVEAFGEDLVDLIKRQAQEVAQSRISAVETKAEKLERENAELKKQLGGVAEQQGSANLRVYLSELGKAVPDYETINVAPEFMAWLAETDPLSGMARQEYLNNAFAKFDVQRTATLFNAYKASKPAAPEPTSKPAVNPELQRQVAPSTSKSSSTPTANPAERVWSLAEIDAFYRDVAKGAYRGKTDEQARIESEIDLAVAQGRLRP